MKSVFKNKSPQVAPVLFTPDNTVAAFIELPNNVNPIEAIWHTSSIALDTDKICFIYSLADDGVYFLSAPASYFVGKNNAATPLAAALPGNPEHKGDGAYICAVGTNLFAVAVKNKQSLSCYIGDKANVIKFAEEYPQYWVKDNDVCWASLTQYIHASTTKLVTVLSVASIITVGALLIATSIFKYQTADYIAAHKEKQQKALMLQQQNTLTLAAANEKNTVNTQLHKYLSLSGYVLKENGRILSYEFKNNTLKYSVELPSTVQELSFFGEVEPIINEDMIVINKEETL